MYRYVKNAVICILLSLVILIFSFDILAQSTTQNNNKTTARFQAIRSGSIVELQEQLANGVDANDTLNGYSALIAASLNGSVDQMKILIYHGANVNYQSRDSITALWLAVPDWDKTKLLLDHGADVNHQIQGYGILVKLLPFP